MVGFDLDMTLIDSRPGIKAVYDRIADETGVEIDTDLVVSRLGPPLEEEMAHWFPPERVPQMAALYRRYYAEIAVPAATALHGAHEAVAHVHDRGGQVVVVTAKTQEHAQSHLDQLGLRADQVHGGAWRAGKADVLRAAGAVVYVGDHVGDVEAAHLAGAVSVAVTTGPCSGQQLADCGADVVLHTLVDFEEWLDEAGRTLGMDSPSTTEEDEETPCRLAR